MTLDLACVPSAGKVSARALVRDAIGMAGRAASEVFVRVDKTVLHADLDAAIWPGLTGLMLPGMASAARSAVVRMDCELSSCMRDSIDWRSFLARLLACIPSSAR